MRYKDPKKKEEIIRFVNQYYEDYQCTPSARMIADKVSLCKSAVLNYLAEMREEGVIDYDNRVIITEAIQSLKEERRQAQIIGSVPCGTLTLETEAAEDIVNLPTRIFGSGELYLLKAYGDSMTGAGIDPGDWVVVHKQEHANNGDLVIALVEGEGSTLKRYFNDPKNKRVILHPENPKYEDIVVRDCVIQGVVRNVIKNY